jgi:hypothetical protein
MPTGAALRVVQIGVGCAGEYCRRPPQARIDGVLTL